MRAQAQANKKCTTAHFQQQCFLGFQSIRDKYFLGEMIKAKVTEKALNLKLELCLDLYWG